MDLSRELAQAARRNADAQSARLAAVPRSRFVWATVVTTSPPIQVTVRGAAVVVAGKLASYTPVVGHRVLCGWDENDQLIILGQVNGQP